MTTTRRGDDDGFAAIDAAATQVLGTARERALLRELAACKAKLADALEQIPGVAIPDHDDPRAVAQAIAARCTADAPTGARLGCVCRRYCELRSQLALANLRLVAHVAKNFRDRGVAHADLMQEGFCGLLEAIDRFDLTHETKLATYATWWIRQAMQRAVAAGAYPVRLSPRHLRQLAQNQDEVGSNPTGPRPPGRAAGASDHASPEMIRRIHAATRPTVSLDAQLDGDSGFNLIQAMSDPEADRTDDVDRGEAVGRLMEALRPREQEVLSLRFGLGGQPRLSLSQVGKVLSVSKERVRQIQDRALEKLRAVAAEEDLADALSLGA